LELFQGLGKLGKRFPGDFGYLLSKRSFGTFPGFPLFIHSLFFTGSTPKISVLPSKNY